MIIALLSFLRWTLRLLADIMSKLLLKRLILKLRSFFFFFNTRLLIQHETLFYVLLLALSSINVPVSLLHLFYI